MKSIFFHHAKEVIAKLEKAGYESYIVGGAVRDHLLQRDIHDIDLATSARVEEIERLFPRTIDVAIKHGTVIVLHGNQSFEVTSFRGNCLLEDLKLRDFTMNAIALTGNGQIIDPYFGHKDIQNKVIRAVDNPLERFSEDPLRMLRAIRFVSKLSFSIEKETESAIEIYGHNINKVAIERVSVELEKIWFGQNVVSAWRKFLDTKLMNKIEHLRPLQPALTDEKIIRTFPRLHTVTEIWSVLLFTKHELRVKEFLKQWKQPNKVITEVELILSRLERCLNQGLTAEDLYDFGLATSKKAERIRAALLNEEADLSKIEAAFQALPITEKKQLAIKGTDVVKFLTKDDPKSRISELLTLAEKAVLMKQVENQKDEIIHWLQKEGFIHA
ncbi:CCA tRNA nucleotidyltransferase [Anaerobacillus sp. CMMVII]|uniref:CCA tRNA nucleotidyltransferase n=1 Tax=Anaerobacillus sp. CMMVII TaxID=2755588 RepID=UPI0021B82294|nr:CCA tRNA nucleotidyltransferase [Anaerobacillus sp. CMMVII]MCT8138921.1 CCA tRNA nucleotidyltransferase [Anaerobacillus sp. CMMVII]